MHFPLQLQLQLVFLERSAIHYRLRHALAKVEEISGHRLDAKKLDAWPRSKCGDLIRYNLPNSLCP